MTIQLKRSDRQEWDNEDILRALRAKYLWWEQTGSEGLDQFAVPNEAAVKSDSKFRSCAEADIAARMYVIEGDSGKAAEQVKYLQERGYAEPGFIRFCTKHALCD
jgi:hypothetical protein